MDEKTERTREDALAWERYLKQTPMVWQLYLGTPEAPTAWLGTFDGVFDALGYLGGLGIANHKILERVSHEKDSTLLWHLSGTYTHPEDDSTAYHYHVQCMVGSEDWLRHPHALSKCLYHKEDT